ncbi:DUF4470 and zf-MYND domain-containing protein [Phanerochaete sordida]|uniref:DUF4470 and zf-MYND domain-containing protein n=1 Tax=Phanerochaete sordida TaxID=48140 RepID=A0A9P3FZN4_9APHY|nr:DUF4470 and zf-MYND domain-containing protein [Phanerochaete sordida]
MAHTVFWPGKMFFYPIGNTSPVSLLQHVPPEDDADILLLGCGDPRNILYSLYASGEDVKPEKRKLDFTCCDFEPAVLARNILLLTLVADGAHANKLQELWNIFYHFFLDDSSLSLLLVQAETLAASSTSLGKWQESAYAHIVDISNSFTLGELNRHWALYAQTKTFNSTRRAEFNSRFRSGMEKVRKDKKGFSDMTASRSAGPVMLQAMMSSVEASRAFWESGTTFTSRQDSDAATEVNPTFAYAMGQEGFLPHYGTNPLSSFHLAPIFATANMKTSPPLSDVYGAIREQFRAWCAAFHGCSKAAPGRLKLRFVVADVLAFCQALQLAAEQGDPSVYPRVSPWKASLLALDGQDYSSRTASLAFDVIDTSNLFDHIGSVNILIATAPLLKKTPFAALYTESLLSSGDDPIVSFADSLCGDVTTMSLLFDLTPTAYLSGYNTQSNIHEIMGYHTRDSNAQYHERLVWKVPSQLTGGSSRPVAVDAEQLATLFFDIYHKMFANENLTNMLQQKASIASLQTMHRIHYTRRSFAELVRSLMPRIVVDWDRVFDHFEQQVSNDGALIMGMNYYQEFMAHLHLARVWSIDTLIPGNPRLRVNKAAGPFRDWSAVPPVVCLTFVVPRAKIEELENDQQPNPILAVEIGSGAVSNYFCSIEAMFGALTVTGSGEHAQATVQEDPKGKSGSADVVVSVCVPAWLLSFDPASTRVRLNVASAVSGAVFMKKLGLRMVVYDVALTDREVVHVLSHRPAATEGAPAAIPYLPTVKGPSAQAAVTLSIGMKKVEKMTRRVDIQETKAKAALASKDTPVTTIQASACELELAIGSAYRDKLAFPFPVDAGQAKLRVARQSSWVEVVGIPCLLGRLAAPAETRFPVGMHKGRPIPWTMHRVDLDRLPAIPTANVSKARLEWINTHVSLAFSDREKLARDTQKMEPFTQIKDSMHSMFVQAVGIQGSVKVSVFGLRRTTSGGIDALLFVNDIRLDVAAHAVVMDAYVLPLHDSFMYKIEQALANIRNLCQVNLSAEEHLAWKYLLPSLVERCRTWTHTPKCAYAAAGARVPLATEHGEVPICACGRGKVDDAFRARKEWAPFLPYVTRIALSPLFAVSFLESVAGGLKEMTDTVRAKGSASGGAPARPSSAQPDVSRCRVCKTAVKDRPMVCSRCKKVAYCSRDCQTKDWKLHKLSCTAA